MTMRRFWEILISRTIWNITYAILTGLTMKYFGVVIAWTVLGIAFCSEVVCTLTEVYTKLKYMLEVDYLSYKHSQAQTENLNSIVKSIQEA